MSTPTTCQVAITAVFQKKDTLFHVLYGANLDYIARMIEESVVNIAREYPSAQTCKSADEGVAGALQLLRPSEGDSLHKLQVQSCACVDDTAWRIGPSI